MTRIHNEYFRRVYVRTLYGDKVRSEELIQQIMERDSALTRELLEKPYRTIIGEESSRKSCPSCKAKLGEGEWVWSWGEYVNAKWHTVCHFCKECFPDEVRKRLIDHRNECGCDFRLVSYIGESLPDWLTLDSIPADLMSCDAMLSVERPDDNPLHP